MPELPEVETTVRELRSKIIGRKILKVWTDVEKLFKPDFLTFKRGVTGQTIKQISRRGKNIIIKLGSGKYILVHQKMTGSLLYGTEINPVRNRISNGVKNPYIHFILYLDKGILALSDLRKFAKVAFIPDLKAYPDYQKLGPEPFSKEFTLEKFREILEKSRGKIKKVLLDQNKIAGIGNIYSDEILFEAKISPLRETQKLKAKETKILYSAIKKILTKAIKAKGTSVSDYRRPSGEKGNFAKFL
ncbi:MAG: DNA-formamidopyrimidine glycosylase, partial [bacterium]|nr:DNA-formamidopyrimidine glycosylase [bacterium]